SLGMATKAVFLSLTRQVLFMIPMLLILPTRFGLNGVWACYPICDVVAAIVAGCMLLWQVRHIKRMGSRLDRLHTELEKDSAITPKN
ncbi:MAG: hypothetical protein K2K26_07645, partial [Muribaculaceae bacterium]|nr:hypothetical protein [Muribaculaceae bacterium]